jgi:arylsulfatase
MDWKVVFKSQDHEGIGVWRQAFTELRAPLLFNLRGDPFERGDSSIEYEKWFFDRSFVVVPSQVVVAKWLESFKDFPIRQKPASFNLDAVMEQLSSHGVSR